MTGENACRTTIVRLNSFFCFGAVLVAFSVTIHALFFVFENYLLNKEAQANWLVTTLSLAEATNLKYIGNDVEDEQQNIKEIFMRA